ncbi:venom serine protease-like [Trichogramma pretiosum]|uniref:venom serine protease-like n=1 Tax=Trichogramma pretiosum TaxID=7493 RepID=UPI0006C93FF5|nr:venom serine protease-like [Trichogramma pretiosum]
MHIFLNSVLYNHANNSPLTGHGLKVIENNDLPYVVLVAHRRHGKICTGTLVTKYHIVTAAHCIRYENPTDLEAIVRIPPYVESHKYPVSSSITYDQWTKFNNVNPRFPSNDIAVLSLEKPVEDIQIGSISFDQPIAKAQVTTVGWRSCKKNCLFPQTFVTVNQFVEDPELCRKRLAKQNLNVIGKINAICTKIDGSTSAALECGDSGGPLLDKQYMIVGIARSRCFSKNKNDFETFNVYTAISVYKQFLFESIKN